MVDFLEEWLLLCQVSTNIQSIQVVFIEKYVANLI
jgi:hypothetical protein